MDWMKYKNTASFFTYIDENYVSDEFKEKIINFDGLFPYTIISDIYLCFPERYDFEDKHPEIENAQLARVGMYRGMCDAVEESAGLELDETLDFLIEHPEYTQFYEPVNFYISDDEEYYVPIEELIEARKKELNI